MIKISDIIQEIAAKHGISQKEAEEFVTAMFDVISQSLGRPERMVKVKGLGTFKLTSVSSRESVNVNTGERIVIEGRDKVSFTPESSMRERVNKPFAQFETVVLNDGVDFSDIDSETVQEKEEANDGSKQENIAIETPITQDNSSPEPAAQTDVQQEVGGTENIGDVDTQKTAPKAEIPVAGNVASSVPDGSIVESGGEKEKQEKQNAELRAEKAFDIYHSNGFGLHSKGFGRRKSRHKHQRTVVWVLFSIIAALLVMSFSGTYYFFSQISERDAKIHALEDRMAKVDGLRLQQHQNTQRQQNPGIADSAVLKGRENANSAVNVENKDINYETEAEEKENESVQRYANDPRIRTGAYNIVGIDKTVTVKNGQTLSSISRKYLGPGMECYVEAVNDNLEVKEGDKVKIPKIALKRIRSKRHD